GAGRVPAPAPGRAARDDRGRGRRAWLLRLVATGQLRVAPRVRQTVRHRARRLRHPAPNAEDQRPVVRPGDPCQRTGRRVTATVQTVLGPVPTARLGAVDAHEHLFLRTPALPGDEFDDLERMVAEAGTVRAAGIQTIVDLTPIGLGRDPAKLAVLSERS